MKLEWKKKEGRQGVLTLMVEGEVWKEIHTSVFGRKPNLPLEYGSLSELKEQFEQAEYRAATVYALKRLSMKSYLSAELHDKLVAHHVSEEMAAQVILKCQSLGYLNDQEWMQHFVQRQLTKNLGPMAILMKLRAKGVPQETAQQLIAALDDGNERRNRISHLLATRYRSRDLSDMRSRGKVIASLMRKGFAFSDIKEALGGFAP